MAKKRMRVAYLKRFSAGYISTGQGPVTNKDDPRWQHTLAGRQQAVTSIAKGLPLPKLQGFGVAVVKIEGQTIVGNKPRVEAVMRAWQGFNRFQGMTGFNFVVLDNGKRFCLKLYFGDNLWFFIREDSLLEIGERSICYSSKETAMWHRHHRKIIYEEEFPLKV